MNEHATIINVTSDAESNEHTFYESPSPQPPCSPTKKRKANKGGPKSDEIWNYYNKGQEKNDGHYSATCYYCSKTWARGKPAKLKAHLANECLPCPPDINHFGSKKPLPLSVTERIDHALLKAWVIAGIPFEVIENPFVIDLFKELNPGYTPPSRTTLSGQLLDQEVARVNLNIEKELESSNNLTLNEISDIVEQIGSDKFAAIVTDAAPACRVAREKTEEMYPHIWDIRCAAHSINLIASGLVKIDDIKEFITKCGKITKFFHNSYQACFKLRQGLQQMKIRSEGLQAWVKTRWGSLYMTTDSILCALPVFDWIIAENRYVISNDEVLFLLQNEDFLTKCHHICSVWSPIKECINILESNTATLADCFIYMIKLAVVIFKLLDSNQFKTSAIHIFNNRYIEFQHPAYLLCYYIHPLYRGGGLRNGGFREAALVAVKLWKNLNHSEQETKLSPYDLPYVEEMDTPELWWGSIKNKPSHLSEIAIRLFGITPTQSNSELLYYDKTSTSNELRNVANDSSVGALMSLESENDYLNN
ncbi:580_t:CDS:2, partial [Entrophospora sp. SA101]